jgi:hypothetical protein
MICCSVSCCAPRARRGPCPTFDIDLGHRIASHGLTLPVDSGSLRRLQVARCTCAAYVLRPTLPHRIAP